MKLSRGIGLVEILVGIFCFLIAVLPLARLFSLNMESARVLHAKAISLAAAREILGQAVLELPERLPSGTFVIPGDVASFSFPGTSAGAGFVLTPLSPGMRRVVNIEHSATSTAKVTVQVECEQIPRANVELARTIFNCSGGRP